MVKLTSIMLFSLGITIVIHFIGTPGAGFGASVMVIALAVGLYGGKYDR